jgi:nucleoside-diphosphate-sugar epimerase
MDETVMVTGGSGFVGAHLVKTLAERGYKVINFDAVGPSGFRKWLLSGIKGQVIFRDGSLLDLPALLLAIKQGEVKSLIHLGALLPGSSPMMTMKVNVEGTINVLEAARIMDLKRVIFASSMGVYAPKQYEPVDEEHPKLPQTPYGSSKAAGEFFGFNFASEYGVDFIALRFPMIYGGGTYLPFLYVIDIVENAVKGVPSKFETGLDVSYDYIYVKDVVQSYILTLETKDKIPHRAYNIGSGQITSVRRTAEIVKSFIPKAIIEIRPGMTEIDSSWARLFGLLDIERARKELRYEPKYDMRSGIEDYIKEFKAFSEK